MYVANGREKIKLIEGKQGQYFTRALNRLAFNVIFKPLFVISKK